MSFSKKYSCPIYLIILFPAFNVPFLELLLFRCWTSWNCPLIFLSFLFPIIYVQYYFILGNFFNFRLYIWKLLLYFWFSKTPCLFSNVTFCKTFLLLKAPKCSLLSLGMLMIKIAQITIQRTYSWVAFLCLFGLVSVFHRIFPHIASDS